MSNPTVTSIDVVIPVHQPTSELRGTVRALLDGTADRIILVCANTESLSNWVSSLPERMSSSPRLQLQWRLPDRGPSYYRNEGLNAAEGDAVLFIDSDCEVTDGLVEAHRTAYARATEPGVKIGAVAGVTNLYPVTGSKTEQTLVSGYYVGCFSKAADQRFVDWAPTSNLSVKSDVLEAVRFDTTFPQHGGGEDVDICWQITDAGYAIAGADDAVVHHALWTPHREIFRRLFRWGRGEYQLVMRHPERTRQCDHELRRRLAEQVSRDDLKATCLRWLFDITNLVGMKFESLRNGNLGKLNTFTADPDYPD